ARKVELDLRCQELEGGNKAAAGVELPIRRLRNLHVLLRHHLLRKAHGFEGRCLVVELPIAQDLAVAEADYDEDPAAHGHSASCPATTLPSNYQYVVATGDESPRLAAVLVPLVEPLLERLAHAIVTAVDTSIGPLWVFVPLDLGIAHLRDELGQ